MLLFVLALALFARSDESNARQKLTTRWWRSSVRKSLPSHSHSLQGGQNCPCILLISQSTRLTFSLATAPKLPRPKLPTKKPIPKPASITSHSYAQLIRLASYSPPSEYTAIIILTATSQIPRLATLLDSISSQSIAPSSTTILLPDGIVVPSFDPPRTNVKISTYPSTQPSTLAFLSIATTLSTPYFLLIDANVRSLSPSYSKTLLRATATKEYENAVLGIGGMLLPNSTTTESICATTLDEDTPLLRTKSIHFPSTPFLVRTDSLVQSMNGIRIDVPIEMAISLALWTKSGMPTFAIPLSASDSMVDYNCDRLRRAIVGEEMKYYAAFERRTKMGEAGEEKSRREGQVMILLSGEDELELAHPLACEMAQSVDVRVYLADSEMASVGQRIFFPAEHSSSSNAGGKKGNRRCHIDVHPLNPGEEVDSIPAKIVSEIDRLGQVEVVIYLIGGERARELGEVLKWVGGTFGGKRKKGVVEEGESEIVVIGLPKEEVQFSEWLGALPIEALRRQSSPPLSIEAVLIFDSTDWHTPKIDISVITNNRPSSLDRLLTSLQSANYYGDEVTLTISLEQTADLETHALVSSFVWEEGPFILRRRILLAGLMPAIVESWYPNSNHSYGVFLEDDTEVSPLFYGWLKFSILYYRYNEPMRAESARLFGISLYQQKNVELRPEGRQPFDAHILFDSLSLPSTTPYLSQIPCSWGAVYFPEIWREFHSYLALRLSEESIGISETIVPEIRSNRWPRSWKKYFIELVYIRGYTMLYPNYEGFESFSTNHLEKGEHNHLTVADSKKKAQFTVPLMSTSSSSSLLDLPDGRLPPWTSLPIIDLWGAITTEEEIIERGWQSVIAMELCPEGSELRIDGVPTYEARELLCPRWKRERVGGLVESISLGATPEQAMPVTPPPLVLHPSEDDDTASPPPAPRSDDTEDEALSDERSRLAQLAAPLVQQAQESAQPTNAAQRGFEDDPVEKRDTLQDLGERIARQNFGEEGGGGVRVSEVEASVGDAE